MRIQRLLNTYNQLLAQWLRLSGQGTLFVFVCLAAFWRLDANRVATPRGEIVRAGPHVEIANAYCEFKALDQQGGSTPWHRFGGPFVEIHIGMQTAGLFVIVTRRKIRLHTIEASGLGREKPKGIVVRAANCTTGDKVVDILLRKP